MYNSIFVLSVSSLPCLVHELHKGVKNVTVCSFLTDQMFINPLSVAGPIMDEMWNEIQAYLSNRTPDEQVEWRHYNTEKIGRVLMQVSQWLSSLQI